MKPPMAIEPLWGGQHVKAEPRPAGCLHVPCAHCGPGSLLLMGCRTLCLQISRVGLPPSSENTAIPVSVGLFTTWLTSSSPRSCLQPRRLPNIFCSTRFDATGLLTASLMSRCLVSQPDTGGSSWASPNDQPTSPLPGPHWWPPSPPGSPFPQGAALHLLLPGNA